MKPRITLAVPLFAAIIMAAGCASTASPATAPATPARPPSLATSLATPAGTWAVAVLGGSAANHNNFWQLFVRPAGTSSWKLATPPGVASNGGLILAAGSGGSLLAAFRPSQDLSYSPFATTTGTSGKAWTPGLLDAALADDPSALAADPSSGRLLALLTDGSTEISRPGGTGWTRLTTRRGLAATTAGTRCRPGALTAVAFGMKGEPLLAAGCGRPGTAGIFAYAGRTWRLAAPVLPAGYAHQAISVLRLATAGGSTTALLAAGTGRAARLLAAWSRDDGAHWSLSAPFPLNASRVVSASPGPDGSVAVVLSSGRAAAITATTRAWQPLPALPPGTATLAPGTAGGWDALAAHRTTLAIWQAAPGAAAWTSTQVINVPVPFGSSG